MFDKKRVVCTDWYETKDYMWLCLSDRNIICKVDKVTGEVHILGSYPGHVASQSLLSSGIVFCDGKIVFVPCVANSIAIVNIETDEVSFVPLQSLDHPSYDFMPKFVCGFEEDGYVYMPGLSYPAMIRLSVAAKKVEYITEFADGMRRQYVYGGIAKKERECFFSTAGQGELMCFSLDTKTVKFCTVCKESGSFFGLAQEGENIWLTCFESSANYVFRYNIETQRTEKIILPVPGCYHAPIFYQGVAYLLPYEGDSVVMINLSDRSKVSVCEELSGKLSFGDWAAVMAVKQIGKSVKFITGGSRYWYEYDLEEHTLSETYYEWKDDEFSEAWKEDMLCTIANRKNAVVENELLLSQFMHLIGERTTGEVGVGENCGKKIYDILKEM